MIIGQLRITEHREETLHIVHVPAADIPAESAAVEHACHVFHVADIPLADIAVEIAAIEHVRHIRHIADIPLADVTVECLELIEKFPHILDCGRIDAIQVRTRALTLYLFAYGSNERRLCFRRMFVFVCRHVIYSYIARTSNGSFPGRKEGSVSVLCHPRKRCLQYS